jgi:hypothetical protein
MVGFLTMRWEMVVLLFKSNKEALIIKVLSSPDMAEVACWCSMHGAPVASAFGKETVRPQFANSTEQGRPDLAQTVKSI